MHIDQALQKRKQFKVKCINIFVLIKSSNTNIMKQTKGLRSALLLSNSNNSNIIDGLAGKDY